MSDKDDKLPPGVAPPAGLDRDRRRAGTRGAPPKLKPGELGTVGHDDLGNAVWNWRVEVPHRRDDDPTVDLLQSLDIDGLSLEEDDDTPEDNHFNPYNRQR